MRGRDGSARAGGGLALEERRGWTVGDTVSRLPYIMPDVMLEGEVTMPVVEEVCTITAKAPTTVPTLSEESERGPGDRALPGAAAPGIDFAYHLGDEAVLRAERATSTA